MEWLFTVKTVWKRKIQVDREMQVPKIRGFIKADLQIFMP